MAPVVKSNVADNPSGAAGANAGPSTTELMRQEALRTSGPVVDSKSTQQAEARKAAQRAAELNSAQLQGTVDLALAARRRQAVESGRGRQQADNSQAYLDSARQAAAAADRARVDVAKPQDTKQQQASAKDIPPANKPTNAELARNSKNPNQQQPGQDSQNPNASKFVTSVPYDKAAAATLAQMSKGKVSEQKVPESLADKLAAKSDQPAKPATPAQMAATPAKPGEQKPAEAQAAQLLAKNAGQLADKTARAEQANKKEKSTSDNDDVDKKGSASPTAGSAAVASDQRVERKGEGDGERRDQHRDTEQLVAFAESSGARSTRTLPTVQQFSATGDQLGVGRAQRALDAKAGLSAVTQSVWSNVVAGIGDVGLSRAGLGARIMSGHADLALLLQMQLTTANARVG